jgi:hypothetical protein
MSIHGIHENATLGEIETEIRGMGLEITLLERSRRPYVAGYYCRIQCQSAHDPAPSGALPTAGVGAGLTMLDAINDALTAIDTKLHEVRARIAAPVSEPA